MKHETNLADGTSYLKVINHYSVNLEYVYLFLLSVTTISFSSSIGSLEQSEIYRKLWSVTSRQTENNN